MFWESNQKKPMRLLARWNMLFLRRSLIGWWNTRSMLRNVPKVELPGVRVLVITVGTGKLKKTVGVVKLNCRTRINRNKRWRATWWAWRINEVVLFVEIPIPLNGIRKNTLLCAAITFSLCARISKTVWFEEKWIFSNSLLAESKFYGTIDEWWGKPTTSWKEIGGPPLLYQGEKWTKVGWSHVSDKRLFTHSVGELFALTTT